MINLSGLDGDGSALLKGDATSESDLAGYNIYQDGVKIISSPITGNQYEVLGLVKWTNLCIYRYCSRHINNSSNAISVTLIKPGEVRAILTITMVNGVEKEYDLSGAELNTFFNWYDAKDAGGGLLNTNS